MLLSAPDSPVSAIISSSCLPASVPPLRSSPPLQSKSRDARNSLCNQSFKLLSTALLLTMKSFLLQWRVYGPCRARHWLTGEGVDHEVPRSALAGHFIACHSSSLSVPLFPFTTLLPAYSFYSLKSPQNNNKKRNRTQSCKSCTGRILNSSSQGFRVS